jgi:cobalt-zinc-cadmium efflux system membrane fusion protein
VKSNPQASIAPRVGENAASSEARGKPRTRRLAIVGAGALALAFTGGALLLSQRSANGKEDTKVASDVPRIEGGHIVFSEAFMKRAGLESEPSLARVFQPTISAVGATDFDPQQVAAVGTRLRGLVSRVAKFEGDVVEKGALLAVIESPELGEAQASVRLLAAEKNAAELNSRREVELVGLNLSTARESELAQVELKKYEALLGAAEQKVYALAGGPGATRSARLGAQELRAPFAGTVVECRVSPGQAVEGDLMAFKIANLDRLWIELQVFEQNLSLVRLGDRVELRPLTKHGDRVEGRVARIGATVDLDTRSGSVRVEIDNRDRHLRAGQAMNATIHTSGRSGGAATLVPSSAVTYVDGKPTVFVAESPTKVRVAKIEMGAASGDVVEVKSGVAPGERVVTRGAFALKSELFR